MFKKCILVLQTANSVPAEEIVACANGLLHLPNLRLLPHSPNFYTHNALDFAFDPVAPQPKHWLGFLEQLWPDDPTTVKTLQEIFGLSLTGDTSHQKAFLMIGPRRCGKGTIARVLARLIGAENAIAPTLV
jgi:putative DNA primase/helicase